MPKYDSWTVELRKVAEIHLIIDDKDATDFLKSNAAEKLCGNELKEVSKSAKITSLFPDRISKGFIEIHLGKAQLKLNNDRFRKTILFNKPIENVNDLVCFWKQCGDFLNEGENEKVIDTRESFEVDFQQDERISRDSLSGVESKKQRLDPFERDDMQMLHESGFAEGSSSSSDDEKEQEEILSREALLKSIRQKKVATKFMNIFDLKEPPPKFQVRSLDTHFVNQLTEMMIEKQSLSIENAPTVVGVIDIKISEYRDEDFSTYKVFIVDGNHSVHAQKAAYRKTKSLDFKYRTVNIYCGLSQEEALFLGVSRNEDTKSFTKFSDYQKVNLLRRQLYQLSKTREDKEPPKANKDFRELFKSFLNLKGKSDVCGKNILRFLSTTLSNKSYAVFKKICDRKSHVPASKFDCLRGLSEENTYRFLQELEESNLEKEDWQNFTARCLENQNKKTTKQRKDVTASIHFKNDKTTRIYIGNKVMIGNVICLKVLDETEYKTEKIFTHLEFKKLLMGKTNDTEKDFLEEHNCTGSQIDASKRKSNGREKDTVEELDYTVSKIDTNRKFFKGKQKTVAVNKQNQYVKKCLTKPAAESTPLQAKMKGSKRLYSFCSDEEYSPIKSRANYNSNFSTEKLSAGSSNRALDRSLNTSCSSSLKTETAFASSSNGAIDSCVNTTYSSSFSTKKAFASSSKGNFDSSLKIFLKMMVDESVFLRVVRGLSKIEEDEVEIRPQELLKEKEILLDSSVQAAARTYFDEDAWLCVANTLRTLAGISPDVQSNASSNKRMKLHVGERASPTDKTTCRDRLQDVESNPSPYRMMKLHDGERASPNDKATCRDKLPDVKSNTSSNRNMKIHAGERTSLTAKGKCKDKMSEVDNNTLPSKMMKSPPPNDGAKCSVKRQEGESKLQMENSLQYKRPESQGGKSTSPAPARKAKCRGAESGSQTELTVSQLQSTLDKSTPVTLNVKRQGRDKEQRALSCSKLKSLKIRVTDISSVKDLPKYMLQNKKSKN